MFRVNKNKQQKKKQTKKEVNIENSFLWFEDNKVAITHSEQLKDNSTFVIIEKPVQINHLYGPTEPSSYYIIYKNGSFEVAPNQRFEKSVERTYANNFKDFLSREVRKELFCNDNHGRWPKVKIA